MRLHGSPNCKGQRSTITLCELSLTMMHSNSKQQLIIARGRRRRRRSVERGGRSTRHGTAGRFSFFAVRVLVVPLFVVDLSPVFLHRRLVILLFGDDKVTFRAFIIWYLQTKPPC